MALRKSTEFCHYEDEGDGPWQQTCRKNINQKEETLSWPGQKTSCLIRG